MDPTSFLFYSFAIILLGAAIAVVTVKNPIHSALFLILSFFSASAIWILLEAEFLALTLVLVYVGAVIWCAIGPLRSPELETISQGRAACSSHVPAFSSECRHATVATAPAVRQ